MNGRSQTADLLKGVAVILMINVHIIELFATPDIYNSAWGKILLFSGGPPVAPVFTLILGYYIAASQKSLFQQTIRGIKILLLGMLLNFALNLNLITAVFNGVKKIDLLPYIFGVDILHFAGISIIIIAVLKKAFSNSLFFVIICIIISLILGQFLLNFIPENSVLKYVSGIFYGSNQWSYFPLFPWLSYPLSGFAFYKLKQHPYFGLLNSVKTKVIFGILFIIFLVLTLDYAISISSNLEFYYHHGFLFYLWVVTFLSFYCFFIYKMEGVAGEIFIFKYFKWLGKNVTVIYFIQWIIIGNIATEIYKTVSFPPVLLIYLVAVIFTSSCIGYMAIRIKDQFMPVARSD